MPRFVILRHTCPPNYVRPSHWDLMFEVEDGLRTWAFPELPGKWQFGADRSPSPTAHNAVYGEELDRHRLDYLTIEGPLSGARGHVARVEEGTYQVVAESAGCWELQLAGRRISGRLRLMSETTDSHYWRLEWSDD